MQQILAWWLVVEVVGLIGWRAGMGAFRRLPDLGFAWSKALGILLIGGCHWLLTSLGVLRNDLGGTVLAAALVAAVAWKLGPPAASLRAVARAFWTWIRRRRRLLWVEEAVFVTALLAWGLVRHADPAVSHTEQPMDLMFLTAVSEQAAPPPGDSWLAGEPISYYYLGYWLLAALGRLAGTAPEVSYNLGQATWWALLASGAFGLGFHVTRSRLGRGSSKRALAGGGLAAIGIALASNLHLAAELILGRSSGSDLFGDWWWWRASRVVVDQDLAGHPIEVITEFPFFSYLLGDDHPHLLSMPFLLLVAALSFALARDAGASAWPTSRPPSHINAQQRAALALGAFAAALLIPLNTWDFPAGFALLLGGLWVALWQPGAESVGALARRVFTYAATLAGVAALVALPFLLTAQSQVQGLRPNLLHPTSLVQAFLMFGLFVPGLLLAVGEPGYVDPRRARKTTLATLAVLATTSLVVLLWGYFWATRSTAGLAWISAAGGVEAMQRAAPARWLQHGWTLVAILALLAVVASQLLAWRSPTSDNRSNASRWLLVSIALAFGLLVGPELLYVQDLFGTRMNTVFKLWYQAWPFLALASAVGLASANWRRWSSRGLALLGLALLGIGLLYPAAALSTKRSPQGGSFDGLAHLGALSPGLRLAALWLRSSTPADARLVEAPGDSYHAEQNVVSAASGRATLLGWRGHEEQWRGSAYKEMSDGRESAAAAIYAARDARSLAELLEHWQVEYVLYGPRERELYGATDPDTEQRLRSLMTTAFDAEGVTILQRQR